jgi:hypothetical protein
VDSYRYVLGNIETSFKSVSKYRPAKEYDSQILQKATAMLHASYSAVERGKLTEDYFHSFDQSSSPGYPYNKFGKKRDLLRDQKLVDNIQKNVKNNVIPDDNYWNLFVKSEPKKTEKIENHDERTVVGASLDLLAESVYLFGHMNANIYRVEFLDFTSKLFFCSHRITVPEGHTVSAFAISPNVRVLTCKRIGR